MLELVFERHHNQQTRFSDVTLWSMLLRVGFSLGQDEVVTVLQDLCDRGYVRFEEEKNRRTGRTTIALIQVTPKGRDLVERGSKTRRSRSDGKASAQDRREAGDAAAGEDRPAAFVRARCGALPA